MIPFQLLKVQSAPHFLSRNPMTFQQSI